ncbi:hypothetical protein [Vibrio owensii]|uniref:hypothetical protein n=1 Tax=Vibrio owensii TaxID=696485 RepID=UPI001F44E002|nr:hypothetical protein [Vibrio owensii]
MIKSCLIFHQAGYQRNPRCYERAVEVTLTVKATIAAMVEASFMDLVMKANKKPALAEKLTTMFIASLNEKLPAFYSP